MKLKHIKIFDKKPEAYALFFAIFIFVLIIILSSTLILSAYYNNHFFNRIIFIDRLNTNASSAINILLAHPETVGYSESKFLSLYGEYGDSVKLEKEQWGVFDLFTVTAFNKELQVKRSVMTGDYKYDTENIALFVPDQGKPISVTGNVNIKGNSVLPESGFKQAHIEGKTFTGNRITGEMQKSSRSLPELNERIARLEVRYFLDKYLNESHRVIPFEKLGKDTLVASFLDSTVVLYSPQTIHLDRLFLRGKIIVLSEEKIRIGNYTDLSDIICVAPFISTEKDFTGKLQLFAGDSIHVGDNCLLKYPSVAGITASNAGTGSMKITIGEKTALNGLTFLYQKTAGSDKQPLLRLEKESVVKGQAYSNGYTEIKGNIYGALYTSRFFLSTPSAIYENTLMDVDIDIFKLSQHYVGADLINEKTTGGIIKWVY
ncbi:MAG: hypothetical protein LBR52_03765 [Prevotellaceae bacterium]|nr:hypothetical protein [Prevotellaceae bacterium]